MANQSLPDQSVIRLSRELLSKYLRRIEKLAELSQNYRDRGDSASAKHAQALAMGLLKIINDHRVDKSSKPYSIRIWIPSRAYNNITPIFLGKSGKQSRKQRTRVATKETESPASAGLKTLSAKRDSPSSRALRSFRVLPEDAPAIKQWKYARQATHFERMIPQFERLVKHWRGRGDEARARMFEHTIQEYRGLVEHARNNAHSPQGTPSTSTPSAPAHRVQPKKSPRKPTPPSSRPKL